MLGEKNGEFTLTTGNLILTKRVESLSASLDKVNKANFEELDNLFNKTIMEDEKKGQKGAGLGFIDIKMKSRNNIIYNFSQVDADYSFFEIQVKVSEKK